MERGAIMVCSVAVCATPLLCVGERKRDFLIDCESGDTEERKEAITNFFRPNYRESTCLVTTFLFDLQTTNSKLFSTFRPLKK